MVAEKKTVCRSSGVSAQDGLDVVDEAHVEHAIGFIEHDHLDLVEAEAFALEVIHDAAGRADDDLRAGAQAAELALVGLAAVDRQLAHAALEEGELRDLLGDLDDELASRAKDDDLRRAQCGIDRLDGGNTERRGLAGAGLRLADNVRAFEQHRDRGGLNRRSLFEAHPLDRAEDFGREAELGEKFLLHHSLEHLSARGHLILPTAPSPIVSWEVNQNAKRRIAPT